MAWHSGKRYLRRPAGGAPEAVENVSWSGEEGRRNDRDVRVEGIKVAGAAMREDTSRQGACTE